MVKCHEDAYWLNNLSLFALDIEGYWEQKKQSYEGKQAASVIIFIAGVFKSILFITGCPKKGPTFDLLFFNV